MRNLKKFLALVLAMVMAMSLMITANAANVSFEDDSDITEQFEEAALVLGGLGVFKGTDEGKFNPKAEITRAEVAAIIYRLVTGDINDNQVKIYADYNKFEDVSETAWYAGYVGFCANAEYIKGHNGYFYPMTKVTGYEALAMILRAVGYDQAGEFSGSGWQVRVASLAKQKHVTDTVTNDDFATTLNKAATREVVAELLFRASLIPQVTYSSALGYNDKKGIINNAADPFNLALAEETFGLYQTAWSNIGTWGEPGYTWKADRCPAGDRTVATIMAEPTFTTNEVMRECDLAEELDIKSEATFDLYVNSKGITAEDYRIVATDTVTRVGGQGRQVKVYTDVTTQWVKLSNLNSRLNHVSDDQSDYPDTVVMIDTVLAKVTGKADAVLDPAGHVITPAKLYVNVYDKAQTVAGSPNPTARTISKQNGSADNWEYSNGDMLLLNAYTNQNQNLATQQAREENAFRTAVVNSTTVVGSTRYPANTLVEGKSVWLVDGLTSKDAKQTLVYLNQDKHNVDNKDELDALTLYLDVAGNTMNTTFKWYFDQFGNLIGIDNTGKSTYGVITGIYAAYKTNDNSNTDGSVQAIASVLYSDGTTGTEVIDRFLLPVDGTLANDAGKNFDANGSEVKDTQADWGKEPSVDTTTGDSNTVELLPVYDTTSEDPLGVGVNGVPFTKRHADQTGWLFLAPQALRNLQQAIGSGDKYGVMFDHMFKFVKSNNDETTAIQVAGFKNHPGQKVDNTVTSVVDATHGAHENNGIYEWLYNGSTPNGGPDGSSKIFKNSGFVNILLPHSAGKINDTNVTAYSLYVDNETQIIIQNQDDLTKHTTYKGVSALPGDVDLTANTEVMWADPDGDGRAEFLKVTGKVTGVTTYGLVYFNANEMAANWNGTTGTMSAYLNGEATTLTFNNESLYNAIANTKDYKANLFAVQMFNGVVSDVLKTVKNDAVGPNTEWTTNILMAKETGTTAYANVNSTDIDVVTDGGFEGALQPSVGSDYFHCGKDYGNEYVQSETQAIYYDDIAGSNTQDVTFRADPLGDTVSVNGTTYYFGPNTKRVGVMELLNSSSWNDVTIVYDKNSLIIREIYVVSDPNVTPSEPAPGAKVTNATIVNLTPGGTYTVAQAKAAMAGNSNRAVMVSGVDSLTGDACPTSNLLFFPFFAKDSSKVVSFTVKNSDNTVVWAESNTSTYTGSTWEAASIDVTGTYKAATGVLSFSNLVANPGEYTFEVYYDGALVSSGSFTIG